MMLNAKKLLSYSLLTGISILLFLACTYEDPAPTANLNLTIVNYLSQPQNNTKITLYKTFEDWSTETNAVTSSTTNDQGKVQLYGLPGGTYYYDATYDIQSNWEGNTIIQLEALRFGLLNEKFGIITPSFSNVLSKSDGYTWSIDSVFLNGTYIDSLCLYQNEFTFYKGGNLSITNGADVCIFDYLNTTTPNDSTTNSWAFDPTFNELQLTNNLDTINLLVTDIKYDSLNSFISNRLDEGQNLLFLWKRQQQELLK